MPPGVSDQVKGAPASDVPEGRQCLVLHCVAGVLHRKQGRLPTAAEVASAAAKVRKDLLDRAVSSDTALGPVPEELSRAEADLRIYAHDLRHWAHDKDYRCLAAYPLPFFSRYRLLFLRVDSRGHVTSEEIRGADATACSEPIVLVIYQGHMRLVCAAPGLVSGAFPHPRVVPALGWADLLEAAGTPEAWYKPGAVLRCAHCVPNQDTRRTGRGFGVLGLHPHFRAHAPTLKAGGPTVAPTPLSPAVGATCWCFGSAARAFARALRLLAVAAVCLECFVWPSAPEAPTHVWIDFRGARGLSASALGALARSASAAGCSVTLVGPAGVSAWSSALPALAASRVQASSVAPLCPVTWVKSSLTDRVGPDLSPARVASLFRSLARGRWGGGGGRRGGGQKPLTKTRIMGITVAGDRTLRKPWRGTRPARTCLAYSRDAEALPPKRKTPPKSERQRPHGGTPGRKPGLPGDDNLPRLGVFSALLPGSVCSRSSLRHCRSAGGRRLASCAASGRRGRALTTSRACEARTWKVWSRPHC